MDRSIQSPEGGESYWLIPKPAKWDRRRSTSFLKPSLDFRAIRQAGQYLRSHSAQCYRRNLQRTQARQFVVAGGCFRRWLTGPVVFLALAPTIESSLRLQ